MSIKKFYTDVEIKGNLLAEGISIVGAFTFPTVDGTAGQVLSTDGAGNVSWQSLAALSLTTDDVIEGLNLYFTQERAEDTIGALIQNGTGLNWTYNDLANTLVGNVTLSPFSTTNLAEGVNLYFTNERVDDRVAALIQNGTGLTWTYNDVANTLTGNVSLAPFSTTNLAEGVNLYFTNERVDDRVAALIQNGTGISWLYNDISGLLTPTITLAPFSTSDLAEGVNLYYTDERVDDRVAALIQDSATVTWTYNDGLGTLTANASSAMEIQDNGSPVGTRSKLNFITGPGVILSIGDDGINNRVNIDISVSSIGTLSIFDLVDVDSISPIEDGYVLTYELGTFKPAAPVIPISITVSGARKSTSTNVYMNQNEVDMFTVPFILPDDCELLYLSASSDTIGTWDAEVHVNGSLVVGAVVTVSASKKAYIKFNPTISFSAGDEVQLYCNGSSISKPRISATFVAYQ